MWRVRLFQQRVHRRLKEIILIAVMIVFLLLVVPKTGIYNIVISKLRLINVFENAEEIRLGKKMFSPSIGAYHLEYPDRSDFSRGQSKVIDDILAGKENGYFVDLGAGDGETNSVSLFFERERKWHGVLVEENETKLKLAINKNRQSHMWNFRIRLNNEVALDSDNDIRADQLFEMINRTFIDLLIINLKGLELDLLRFINFTRYHIQVITIELENSVTREKYEEITTILTSNGYMVAHHIVTAYQGKKDIIYKRR